MKLLETVASEDATPPNHGVLESGKARQAWQGPWQAWQGVIETTDVLIACNECRNEADCNLNGVCNEGGSCDCYENVEGSTFLGPRCEVVLKDNCRTIIGGKSRSVCIICQFFGMCLH